MSYSALSLQAAFRYLFVSEVYALKQLAQSLPANPVVVNIGAGSGTSGLAFMESRPDLRLITIDIVREDSPFGCLVAEERVINEAFPETTLYSNDRYFPMQHDSKSAGLLWRKSTDFASYELGGWGKGYGLVDMVFVDGDHSYNGAKGDILAWLPNIKPGGIMAVHDFNKREVYKDGPIEGAPHPLPWPGVDRAVRKFLCPYFEMILKVDTLVAFRIDEEGYQKLLIHQLEKAAFTYAKNKGLKD